MPSGDASRRPTKKRPHDADIWSLRPIPSGIRINPVAARSSRQKLRLRARPRPRYAPWRRAGVCGPILRPALIGTSSPKHAGSHSGPIACQFDRFWTQESEVSADAFRERWEDEYLPLIRIIDGVEFVVALDPGERTRIDELRAIDPDDIPSAALAMVLEAFTSRKTSTPSRLFTAIGSIWMSIATGLTYSRRAAMRSNSRGC